MCVCLWPASALLHFSSYLLFYPAHVSLQLCVTMTLQICECSWLCALLYGDRAAAESLIHSLRMAFLFSSHNEDIYSRVWLPRGGAIRDMWFHWESNLGCPAIFYLYFYIYLYIYFLQGRCANSYAMEPHFCGVMWSCAGMLCDSCWFFSSPTDRSSVAAAAASFI